MALEAFVARANSWRDPDTSSAKPTIFDHAAGRISEEVRDCSGLDPTQVVALAAVQELEHERQATLGVRRSALGYYWNLSSRLAGIRSALLPM